MFGPQVRLERPQLLAAAKACRRDAFEKAQTLGIFGL
jgi:hypothetical protein